MLNKITIVRYSTALKLIDKYYLFLAVSFVAVVHLAFLTTPLHVDEAGLALVGHAMISAHDHGHSLYGNLWIDRSPLLLVIYGGMDLFFGHIGIRIIGLIAGIGTVLVVNALAKMILNHKARQITTVIVSLLVSLP